MFFCKKCSIGGGIHIKSMLLAQFHNRFDPIRNSVMGKPFGLAEDQNGRRLPVTGEQAETGNKKKKKQRSGRLRDKLREHYVGFGSGVNVLIYLLQNGSMIK